MRLVGWYQCCFVNIMFLLYLLLFYIFLCNFIYFLNNDLQIGEEFNMGKNLVVKVFKIYYVVLSQVMFFKFFLCEFIYDKEFKFFRFEIWLQYFRLYFLLLFIFDLNFVDDFILICFYQSFYIFFQVFVYCCILFYFEFVVLVVFSFFRLFQVLNFFVWDRFVDIVIFVKQGYVVYLVKNKLKFEYLGFLGQKIKELKMLGVQVMLFDVN